MAETTIENFPTMELFINGELIEYVQDVSVTYAKEDEPVHGMSRHRWPIGLKRGNKSATGSFSAKPRESGDDLDFVEMWDNETEFTLVTNADQRRMLSQCRITNVDESGDQSGEHGLSCSFIAMRYNKNS